MHQRLTHTPVQRSRAEAEAPRSVPQRPTRPVVPVAPGNRSTHRLLSGELIQPSLRIGPVDDPLEREADRVAARVMRMPVPDAGPMLLQHCGCPGGAGKHASQDEDPVRRAAIRHSVRGAPSPESTVAPRGIAASISRVRGGSGRPLAPDLRSFFEPRFGQTFDGVRLHTGARASASAAEVNARAYTVGRDIVFARGEFAPSSVAGRRLIAHELTHVMQQGAAHGNRSAYGVVQRDPPISGGQTAEPSPALTDAERSWLYQRIEHRLGTAFTKFAVACERYRAELRAIAARQAEAASLVLDVVLTFATPGIGRLLAAQLTRAATSAASRTVQRIAQGALDRSDQIMAAAGSVAKAAAKRGFEGVLSRSPEENFVDELMQEMSVAIDRLHGSLPEKSDTELSIIYANYDPSIATLEHYVDSVGDLIALYQSDVAPIGRPTGGAYGAMKARWVEGSHWRALALTGEGRYYHSSGAPLFISWISPQMRSLAISATEHLGGSIDYVHYADVELSGAPSRSERVFPMLDSETPFLYQCGMVVEPAAGVRPRVGASCPSCHGEVVRRPGGSLVDRDLLNPEAFGPPQNLPDEETMRALREYVEALERD